LQAVERVYKPLLGRLFLLPYMVTLQYLTSKLHICVLWGSASRLCCWATKAYHWKINFTAFASLLLNCSITTSSNRWAGLCVCLCVIKSDRQIQDECRSLFGWSRKAERHMLWQASIKTRMSPVHGGERDRLPPSALSHFYRMVSSLAGKVYIRAFSASLQFSSEYQLSNEYSSKQVWKLLMCCVPPPLWI
jgi:hypothetical protein